MLKDDVVTYALSVTKCMYSCENLSMNHHFVHEDISRGDIGYIHENPVNMNSQKLLVRKSYNRLNLVDTHC